MAYSLPAMNAAANYAASFRQIQPVADFSDIRSDVGVQAMHNTLMQDFQAKALMAKQALAEMGANIRQDSMFDYYRERDEIARKNAKLGALANLMAGSSTQVGIPARTRQGDSRTEMERQLQYEQNLLNSESNRLGNLDPVRALSQSLAKLSVPEMYSRGGMVQPLDPSAAQLSPPKLKEAQAVPQDPAALLKLIQQKAAAS